jgi:exodeoxyribonuclease V gamma subunit
MPGLTLFTSNRMEILVEHLANVLKDPLASPLAGEIILVQSKGMERWLSMELARRHGICANIRFPYPIHFVNSLFRELLPGVPEHSPYEPAIVTWDIMQVLPSLTQNPGFETPKAYLERDEGDLKLFQLSGRIAVLFDQYLLFRPDMILRWDRGRDDHWQAVLWRAMVKRKGMIHRAVLHDRFLMIMGDAGTRLRNVHERISLFGISALPPFHIQILTALSSIIDVNLFLMNPCREFWGDIVSDWEMRRITTKEKTKELLPGDLYLEVGNRLLASMGSLGRDFFHMIGEIHCKEVPDFEEPGDTSLLAAIQSDILNLRERSKYDDTFISENDDSIRVHSCHSPLREIEVLQDSLLALFENDPDIKPDDVLVMIPDIELYAPFIQAVFSIPRDDPRWVPFTIADRCYPDESGLIDTFLRLLDLTGSRYEVSRVLDILEADAVRAKFSLSEEDLELIHHWIGETGIRWGYDEKHRETLGLPAFPWNTWRTGLERMLLGYAMPAGEKNDLFMGILPFNDIEGGTTEILGSYLRFTETLFEFMTGIEEKKTLNEWSNLLLEILSTFFSDDENHLRDIRAIRCIINEIPHIQASSGFTGRISLNVIKAWLRQNLKERGFGAGFLTGGVTFCTILPMRSIPFKVICLIGMNDDSYPRQSRPLGFDLMASSPRIGDRSRRMDDRYLFLEAILSTRMKLHLSYVGQSIMDNSPRPPSVLVSELLDYIEEGFGESLREKIIVPHRLQAFSPAYFTGEGGLFSYSTENFRAAQSALSGREDYKTYIPSRLSEPEEEWKTIDLESLSFFFSNPARFLLNRRLGIYLSKDPAVLNECEPFELSKLEQYFIRQDLIARALDVKPPKDGYPVMQASGRLPHGTPGVCFYESLYTATKDFIRKIRHHLQGDRREPAILNMVIDGFRLTGRLVNIYPGGLIFYHPAKMRGRDRLSAWISHLVLNHLRECVTVRETTLVCEDRTLRYSPVEDTEAYLHTLLFIYWCGLRKPLHFFPESSLVYAEQVAKGADPEKAIRTARNKWDAFQYAEKEDPYYDLCFRQSDPLDAEFRELATNVFETMLIHEEQIK